MKKSKNNIIILGFSFWFLVLCIWFQLMQRIDQLYTVILDKVHFFVDDFDFILKLNK